MSCIRLSSAAGDCHGGLVNSVAAGKNGHSVCFLQVCLHQPGDRAVWQGGSAYWGEEEN